MQIITFFTKFLHYLPGEVSHHIALKGLKLLYTSGLFKIFQLDEMSLNFTKERDIMKMPNKIGIAAGLDKNGDYIDCLAALGISFIEVGTVTPRPQKGNPKPRIFKNLNDRSLLNRLGFNNKGVDYLVKRLKKRKTSIFVGVSIGKNFDTPNDKASDDYIYCLKRVYEFSDYIAINISSPNTKNLRDLSSQENLNCLLQKIKDEHKLLSSLHGYKPIFVKISPDESLKNLKSICESLLLNNIDGIICSNTTIEHDNENGMGGLSGSPLKTKSNASLEKIKLMVGDRLTIMASGGVMNPDDYLEKLDKGANLVQIYTGFIFEGPKLIKDILNLKSPQ
jgi:dihydroorotate dehydrogenase